MAEGRQQQAMRIEGKAMREFAALHAAPVFYGRGVPRGDGRLVAVIPGLFGTDHYLRPLRQWLRRIGYRPTRSSLTINAGCPDRLRNQIEQKLHGILEASPGPVALIGHSRGGMLAWSIASRLQDKVSHLALLGSPAPAFVAAMREYEAVIPAAMAHSNVAAAGARAVRLLDPDCTVPACGCAYIDDIRRPLAETTKVISFASGEDPIVPPSACRIWNGENVSVSGSHSGLVYNRAVYPPLARFLAS